MKHLATLLLFSVVFCFSCQYNSQSFDPTDGRLGGSWQLIERGYSPGFGDVVEPVPLSPVQRVSFHVDGTFTSNIDGLTDFTHYRMVDDTASQYPIVALFRNEPKSVDPSNLEHSYMVEFVDGKLKLSFRFCFEGCHMLFRSLNAEQLE